MEEGVIRTVSTTLTRRCRYMGLDRINFFEVAGA
jgi:hypothetical protein